MRDLAKCKRIVSSALHPLIAADSLGIPNMWVRLHEQTTSKYKFEDYYSAIGKCKTPVYLYEIDSKTLLPRIDNEYDVSGEVIKNKQEELICALKIMKNDLEQEEDDILLCNPYHVWLRIRNFYALIRKRLHLSKIRKLGKEYLVNHKIREGGNS